MPDDDGVVRRIAWKQVCPWLLIFRIFRISISLPVLFVAFAGVLLTPLGWWLADTLFITDLDLARPAFSETVSANSQWPMSSDRGSPAFSSASTARLSAMPWDFDRSRVLATYRAYTSPFAQLLDRDLSVTQAAYLLFGGLWNLIVWAFFGGTITRLAAVQLGREERLGLGSAVRHVARNYVWYVLSPLFPLIGFLLMAVPVLAVGALMRLEVGVVIAGFLWPLVLVAGLIMVIFLVGVMIGWPLMFPTISSEEGSDAFEAFSRSFSYAYQRPLHYLFYALVTILFGGLCWLVVSFVAGQVVEVSLWAASWGAGAARVNAVETGAGGEALGVFLIRACNGFVDVIVGAFNYSFFWCAATAIYLLLRRDTDQMDIDEVFLDSETGRYGLPPLKPEPSPETSPSDAPVKEAADPENAADSDGA